MTRIPPESYAGSLLSSKLMENDCDKHQVFLDFLQDAEAEKLDISAWTQEEKNHVRTVSTCPVFERIWNHSLEELKKSKYFCKEKKAERTKRLEEVQKLKEETWGC